MVLEIRQGDGMEIPKRHVSFRTEVSTVTPYNRQPRKGVSRQIVGTPKGATVTIGVEGKENASSVTALRRSIRSTMSPTAEIDHQHVSPSLTPQDKEINLPKKTHSGERSPFSPLSSILRRSMLQSGRLGPPQRVLSPNSTNMLSHELNTTDVDMSLLISPSAMGNPNDVARTPLMETAPSTQTSDKEGNGKTVQDDPSFTARGNGVQIDLSDMFSGLKSPDKDLSSNNDSLIPTVHTNDLRFGILVDFGGRNIVGQARMLPFAIESPPSAQEFFLEVERIPFTKGINLVVSDPTSSLFKGLTSSIKQGPRLGGPHVANVLTIKPGDRSVLWVTWTPVEEGSIRELILLKLPRGPGRLKVTILGQAIAPTPAKHQSNEKALLCSTLSITRTARHQMTPASLSTPAIATRPSLSTNTGSYIKVKTQSLIPDEWAEKQCFAFAEWLNYIFCPTEDKEHDLCLKQIESGPQTHQQMNRAALRTLVIHQRLAQARSRGFQVFNTPNMKNAKDAIVAEIARGRLALRSDRDVYADLNLRGKMLSLLLSYSTQWLRIGLEVLLGEPIFAEALTLPFPQSCKLLQNRTPSMSRMQRTLKNVIVSRILTDRDILRKYTKGRCNVPSGRFEKKYQEEMRTSVLTRLLVLIVFLDKAKMECILDRVPRLFAKDATVKSTKDVLASLCRDFLSSEGDITKHLSRIGVTVAYRQEPIDELEFRVENLAADIRDGVRLARMSEIISNSRPKTILASLRLPAVSRLQKLHNVGLVIGTLTKQGVPNADSVAPYHIVDGYRDQVLHLLWAVIAHKGLGTFLNADAVEREIQKIESSNRLRTVSWNLAIRTPPQTPLPETCLDGVDPDIQSLILRWCNAVVGPYCDDVTDFSESFADGIVICLLIHYYHPALLPLHEIKPTSRHGLDLELALLNERLNFEMASERMSELGGIPRLLPVSDSRNTPEGKSMFLCLTYLCSRLIESSAEVLSCIYIQSWYRRKKDIRLMRTKIAAAKVIWKAWTDSKGAFFKAQSLKYGWSARVIEGFLVTRMHRLHELRRRREVLESQRRCICTFQAHVRRRQVMMKIVSLRRRQDGARVIQRNWRVFALHRALASLRKRRKGAVKLQAAWRRFSAYTRFSVILLGVIELQARVRCFLVRSNFRKRIAAAVQIQRICRGFLTQVVYQIDLLDIITVQSIVRRHLSMILFNRRLVAVAALQSCARMMLSKRLLERAKTERAIEQSRHNAAVMLQCVIRGYNCRRSSSVAFCRLVSVVKIQRIVRGWAIRHNTEKKNCACVVIQSNVRGYLMRIAFLRLESSVLRIQTSWRLRLERSKYKRSVLSIVKAQAFARGFLVRLCLQRHKSSSIRIQAIWRGYAQQRQKNRIVLSVTLIQAMVRRMLGKNRFSRTIASVVSLQKFARLLKRRHLALLTTIVKRAIDQANNEMDAATRIQASIRKYLAFAHVGAIRSELKETAARTLWMAAFIQLFVRLSIASILIHTLARERRLRLEAKAVTTIQCFTRRLSAAKQVRSLRDDRHHKATIIQTRWRALVARNYLSVSIQAATILQRVLRGAAVRSSIRTIAYKAQVIQSCWRMYKAKGAYRRSLQCVLLLQTALRRRKAERQLKSRFLAILVLQSFGRVVVAKRVFKHAKMDRGAAQIQRIVRGVLARVELHRIVSHTRRIQSAWRMFKARSRYFAIIQRAILIQCIVRKRIAIISARSRRAYVSSLQGFGRIILARKEVRILKAANVAALMNRKSATCIQAMYRRWKARDTLERKSKAATIIQSEWRCFTAFLHYQSDLLDVIIIQSVARRRQAHTQALKRSCALKKIQACVLQWIASRRAKARFAKLVARMQLRCASSVAIQTVYRNYVARAALRKQKAAIMIQKTWRCYSGHVDYLLAILDIMTIQRCARTFIMKSRLARAIPGITAVQSRIRCHLQKRSFDRSIYLITKTQARFRGNSVRRDHSLARQAAVAIQRITRGFLDRIDIEIRDFAAQDIQRVWRGFSDRVEILYRYVMILRIQSAARRFVATRVVEDRRRVSEVIRCSRNYSARKIQWAFKRYRERFLRNVSAYKVQQAARAFLKNIHKRRQINAAVVIQRTFRGGRVRKSRSSKIVAAASRVSKANQRALQNPDLVLGVRTRRALLELQTSKRLTEIMEAAKTLETSTRLSLNCCIAFVQVGAPNILYDLIGTCNRSLPHVEILFFVLLTLQNVSKHKSLLRYVASSKAADLFLDLVQMFRDKQELFIIAVTLLSRVVRINDECKQICSKLENVKRLNHVLKKVSISVQGRQEFTRLSRVNSLPMKHNVDPVRTLRSLLYFLKD